MLIGQLLLLNLVTVLVHTLSHMYVTKHSTVALKCDFRSSTNSLVWRGPNELTRYTDGTQVNPELKNHERFEVTGDHQNGEYDLVIKNFTDIDEGLYQCNTLNNGVPVKAETIVKLKRPPQNIQIQDMQKGYLFVTENKPSTINCTVQSGIPSEIIHLKTNGKSILSGGPGYILYRFIPQTSDHLNVYFCEATSDALEIPLQVSVQLYVFSKPSAKIVAIPTAQVDIGQYLKLSCLFNSTHLETEETLLHTRLNITLQKVLINNTYEIPNVERKDNGRYECHIVNPVGRDVDSLNIIVKYAPFQLDKMETRVYHVETGKQVNISVRLVSFETPIISWVNTDYSGKRGGIQIEKDPSTYDEFIVSSTVLPSNKFDFIKYTMRSRNSAGMADFDIHIIEKKRSVEVFPEHVFCKTGSTFTLFCYIGNLDFTTWGCKWHHFRNNIFIRKLAGSTTGNASILEFPFCDYQDTGNYECLWTKNTLIVSSSAEVLVKSEPIITDQDILKENISVTLRTLFYSHEPPTTPNWFQSNKGLLDSEFPSELAKNTTVMLQSYSVRVPLPGYQADLIIGYNLSYPSDFSCQLQNSFGTTEAIFKATDIIDAFSKSNIKTTNITNKKHKVIMIHQTTEDANPYVPHTLGAENIYKYLLISGTVVSFLVIIFIVSMAVFIKIVKRGFEKRCQNNTNFTVEFEQTETEAVYEDIMENPIYNPGDIMIEDLESSETENESSDSTHSMSQKSNTSYQDLHDSTKDLHEYEEFVGNSFLQMSQNEQTD